MELVAEDIDCFNVLKGEGRGQNDRMNKLRERILAVLVNPDRPFQTDSKWNEISSKLNNTLKGLYSGDVDRMTLTPRGGRGNNHDFILKMFLSNETVFEMNLEFKYNAKTIAESPQYLSLPAKYTQVTYAEFFYDNYITQLCNLHPSLIAPSRSDYLKHVHQPVYEALPFFKTLKTLKSSDNCVSNNLTRISKESIQKFLELYKETVDYHTVIAHIQKTQADKIFLLWKTNSFKTDKFTPEELDIAGPVDPGSKGKNTIVLGCKKSNSTHHMLLRWRNNLCVLFPAWQIKLAR
jgi:hypothetical protein